MGRITGLLFGIVLIWASSAFCNSPSDINAVINGTRVDISVAHPVSDPASHYVQRVAVLKNGESVEEAVFTSQSGAASQDYSRDIPGLMPGDTLGISAYCSKYGSLSKNITVKK